MFFSLDGVRPSDCVGIAATTLTNRRVFAHREVAVVHGS
jgi:hypothetical protein